MNLSRVPYERKIKEINKFQLILRNFGFMFLIFLIYYMFIVKCVYLHSKCYSMLIVKIKCIIYSCVNVCCLKFITYIKIPKNISQ